MTDDELLARVEETPPEEWTPEELDELRARLLENGALREALADQIWLEQALTQGLTKVRITGEQVLARFDRRRRGPLLFGRWWRAAALLAVVAGVGGTAYLQFSKPEPKKNDEPQQPATQPEIVQREVAGTKPSGSAAPTPATSATAAPVESTTVPPTVVEPTTDGDEPWVAMLARPPQPFEAVAFDDRRLTRDVAQLGRWWNTVSGQQRPESNDQRYGRHMAGLFKLAAPWPADATLSVWLYDHTNEIGRFHVWHGEQGVSLEYRVRPYPQWTAYQTTRRGNAPQPATWSFAATDNDRHRRTGNGPVDLRYADGRLYLSRGDTLFLSTPLAGPPEELCFEGTTVLRGMGLARVESLPSTWLPPRWFEVEIPGKFAGPYHYRKPLDWPLVKPAAWKTELPSGATFEPRGNGGTLTAADTTKPAWAAIELPKFGLYDLVIDLGAANAKTGIYLGDADGRPRHSIGFYEFKAGEALHVGNGRPTENDPRYRYDPKQAAAPVVRFPAKLRLACGAGIVKIYASADGRAWGRIMEPIRGVDGIHPTIGVYANAGRGKRSITLVQVMHTPMLPVDEKVIAETPPLPEDGGLGLWYAETVSGEFDRLLLHRRATALLAKGVRSDVANALVNGLNCDLPSRPGHGYAAWQRLYEYDQLTWATDTYDGENAPRWQQYFLERHWYLKARDYPEGATPLTAQRRQWIEAPLNSSYRYPFLPPEMIRDEVLGLVYTEQWEALHRLCQVLLFYGGRDDAADRRAPQREPIMLLVDWAAALAERRRPVPEGSPPSPLQTAFKLEWRHPLVEQFGKEGYNVLAELETALEEKAYPDACRIITGVTAVQAVGLLPNARDPELLVSLPGAVALAMRDHPELRTVMQRDYGELAQLRFKQAAAAGDVDAVRALTTQFFGTNAAGMAQAWLGDRALAQGDAARAEGHYQSARSEAAPDADLSAIDARLRLAAAMLGRNFGDPPTASIVLGEFTLSPAEFERTVAELRAAAPSVEIGPRSATTVDADDGASPLPPPCRFTLKPFAKLEGIEIPVPGDGKTTDKSKAKKETKIVVGLGGNPEQLPRRDYDSAGRQIAVAFAGERMIVSNRFQVFAVRLSDGEVAWRSHLGTEQGKTYQWPLVRMTPIVVDDRVYVRRLLATGPELACLDVADGRIVWRSARGEIVASDPLVGGDRVQAVTLTSPQTETLEATLTTFDARTGKILGRRSLMHLRDYWKRELPLALHSAGDMLLVDGGACIVGCDSDGEPRWLRKRLWLPTAIVAALPLGDRATPIHRSPGGKFNLAEWGSRFVLSIDPRTGSIEPSLQVNLSREWYDTYPADCEIRHGNDGFSAVACNFNKKLWRHRIYWSSETDGRTSTAWPGAWQKQLPGMGPIAMHGNRVFAFTSADAKSAVREIVELLPGERVASESPDIVNHYDIGNEWRDLVPEALMGVGGANHWTLLQSRSDEKTWLANALFLNDDASLTQAVAGAPAVWTRSVTLPEKSPKKLHLRTAAADTAAWNLTVRINGRTVLEKRIEPSPSAAADPASSWRDDFIDLAPYAGQEVRVTLIHSLVPDKNAKSSLAAWQRMEIIDP